ncbi:ComF family protein [Cocleimonas sp. KMM 6892]|uniref:ComF family protein n=1 Tax=unclassified Cocleimonas TaxID=2639732 RepID=UPI002DBB2F62|nr:MULTISPECIES: ComF family protein [unclassified Cocleimonas]MEB8432394.1 ComF family protein [Cocleimonas sp. KMM 6892]MEC4715253.1 ComF family protein [Cocleimonas sp. KMM 6895]MEC4745128.1 ComF family protein [Cocleimonas sp. KMM 6896]
MKLSVLTSNCVLCGDFTQRDISLCKACEVSLPRIEYACGQCGIPLEKAATANALCGQCIQTSPAVDYTISLFHYENPVSYLIGQMKFQQQLSSAAILANLLCSEILDKHSDAGMSAKPDALLPVPLHKSRLAKRGFNQSLEVSREIAKAMAIPLFVNKVERVKNTDAQTHLNKQQRLKNVKGCFNVISPSLARHIVIVDDVITTGATTNELARLLKTKGVEKVGVWSIARADI